MSHHQHNDVVEIPENETMCLFPCRKIITFSLEIFFNLDKGLSIKENEKHEFLKRFSKLILILI